MSDVGGIQEMREQVSGRLGALARRVRWMMAAEGLLRWIVLVVIVAALSLWLDWWLHLGTAVRIVLALAAVAALIFQGWRLVVAPALHRIEPIDLAAALDRVAKQRAGPAARTVAPAVASVLQLSESRDPADTGSRALIATAVRQSWRRLEDIDLAQRIDRRRGGLCLGGAVLIAAIPLLGALTQPGTARLWFERWLLGSARAWPQQTYLYVDGFENDRLVVPRGESIMLRVAALDGSVVPNTVTIRHRSRDGDHPEATAMKRFGPNDFRHEFTYIQAPVTFHVRGGDDRIGPFRIEPVDRPRIERLELSSRHPTDDAPAIRLVDSGVDLSFLPRTDLTLTVTADQPVSSVQLATSLEPSPPLRRVDDRRHVLQWTHDAATQLTFTLVGGKSGFASRPTSVAIGLTRDRPPRVTMRVRGVREHITRRAEIPLTVSAHDDYGVRDMQLMIRTERAAVPSTGTDDERAEPAAAPATTERRVALGGPWDPVQPGGEIDHVLDVATLKLPVASLLQVTGIARDACFQGAQTGRSQTRAFRIIDEQELFREILLRIQLDRAKLRDVETKASALRDALFTVTPAAARALPAKQRLMQRALLRIARSIDASAAEMRWNRLGSAQTHELLQTGVIDPLQALHDGLMPRQLDQLTHLATQFDTAEVDRAVETQEQVLVTIAEVLKRMNQWDSFVDVLNQLNEVIDLQSNVRDRSERLKNRLIDDIFDE